MMTLKLSEKITGLLLFYFIVAQVAIGSTLFVSWRLEGSAAAINDAGSERMRSYHIAFLLAQQVQHPSESLRRDIETQVAEFEKILLTLERGDPGRPLSLPKHEKVRMKMHDLRNTWQTDIQPRIHKILDHQERAEQEVMLAQYRPVIEQFVAGINELVVMVEQSNARATALLRLFQIGLVLMAVVGTALLISLFSGMVIRPIKRLQEGLQRMGGAEFDVRLPVTSQDELGELAAGFNRMASQLQDIYANLEERVAEKSRSVEVKNRELAALDKEMAISEERNLLAQELHDSIAQSLAYLNLQVQLLQEDLQQGKNDQALQGLAQIREGVQESYDDVRELLVHFRTRIGNTDLETAIRSALEKFEGQTGIHASFSLRGTAPQLPPENVLQVMHILQESLSNVRKHAKASHVEVELVNDGKCRLSVRDDGTGFDLAKDAGDTHVGLRIMRERAHRIDANFALESSPGQGTWVRLTLPLSEMENKP